MNFPTVDDMSAILVAKQKERLGQSNDENLPRVDYRKYPS